MDTTWRKMIEAELKCAGESWDDVIAHHPSETAFLDVEFDNGYGGSEGVSFTLWTAKRVYFPVVYDGAEWVSSVPRDPCSEATNHVGGQ